MRGFAALTPRRKISNSLNLGITAGLSMRILTSYFPKIWSPILHSSTKFGKVSAIDLELTLISATSLT